MTQQINLFNPAFRKRRIVLTASRLLLLCAVAVAGMVGYWFFENQEVAGLREELATAQKVLKAQRSHVERIAAARNARPKDRSLEAEIKRLEDELEATRERIETLAGGAARRSGGFAEYLRAFARQSMDGLWLTGFEIGAGGEITIRGRTLSPALVPSYIQRLDREEVLRGRSFAALRIAQPEVDEVAAATQQKPPPPPRFLEFSLATAEPPAAGPRPERTP